MQLLSMARIVAACLACCALTTVTRRARAEHAPPPPIVLAPPPPPELPAPEYARRPFELSAAVLLALPSCSDGSLSNERCDGMGAGAGAGGTFLWRPTPYFGLGGTLDVTGFAFHAAQGSGLSQSHARGHFYGLLARLYFFDRGLVEPYLELGVGSGGMTTSARESDASYDESTSGPALRTGGGLEFYLGRHVRLGPAFDWTTFRAQHVQRCGGTGCIDRSSSDYGHGTGFSSFSVRLSVLLGEGL